MTSANVVSTVASGTLVLKLADASVLYARMLAQAIRFIRTPGVGACDPGVAGLPEAPVFRFASKRGEGVKASVDFAWRTPSFVVLSTVVVFLAGSATHAVVLLALALLTVLVALNPVFTLLVATALPGFDIAAAMALSGLHTRHSVAERRTLANSASPVLVIIGAAALFVLAFALLYYVISLVDVHAFHVAMARSGQGRLSAVTAMYFSVTTAATVGYGDIYPQSGGAHVAVIAQVLTTAAAVTLYVALLLQSRR